MSKRQPAIRPVRSLKDLTQDPLNANEGTQRGRAMLETSVRRSGFGRPVLADRRGRLIAGNKTVQAAAALGDVELVVVKTTGKELVVHQRTDLDLDRDVEAKELAIADNRTSEVGLSWAPANLKTLEQSGVDLRQFWRQPEYAKLLKDGEAMATVEEIPEMALQPFEEYNYLLVVFKKSQDWQGACDRLGIRREGATLGATRKVGLGRVVDGATLMERLATCESSSRPDSGRTASKTTRSRSSQTPPSASAPPKPDSIAS